MMRLFELRTIPMDVVLRGLAILLMAYRHSHNSSEFALSLAGGMTFLLMLSGMNFARFALGGTAVIVRRSIKELARQVFIPCLVVVLLGFVLARRFSWSELLFVENFVSKHRFGLFRVWYCQVLLQLLGGYYLLFSIPPVARLVLRFPARAAIALFAVALLLRAAGPLVWDAGYLLNRVPHMYWWNFALGSVLFFLTTEPWRSKPWSKPLAFACVVSAATVGWGLNGLDGWGLIASTTLLVTVSAVRLPAVLARAIVLVSGATFAIFLLHWASFRVAESAYRLLAGPTAGLDRNVAFVAGVLMCVTCWVAFKAFVRAYRALVRAPGVLAQTA